MSASDSSVYTGHPGTDAHTKQISFTMFCTMERQKRIPFEMSEIFTTVFLIGSGSCDILVLGRLIDWLLFTTVDWFRCMVDWLYGWLIDRLIDWLSVFYRCRTPLHASLQKRGPLPEIQVSESGALTRGTAPFKAQAATAVLHLRRSGPISGGCCLTQSAQHEGKGWGLCEKVRRPSLVVHKKDTEHLVADLCCDFVCVLKLVEIWTGSGRPWRQNARWTTLRPRRISIFPALCQIVLWF